MSLTDVVFVATALVTILAALAVVSSRNIIHSALFLVLSFLGVAAIYFQLNAGFIGLVQILVYAGAISILLIFAIMLVLDRDTKESNMPDPKGTVIGAIIAGLITALLACSIMASNWSSAAGKLTEDAIGSIAVLLMGDYVIAFEVAAVLLLVAIVGAIILAKGAGDKK